MSQKEETKRDRFVRLANYRTSEAMKVLRRIGNLSNKQLYDYESKDVYRMFATIEKRLKESKAKFVTGRKDIFKIE